MNEAKLKEIASRWAVTPDAPGRSDIDLLLGEVKHLQDAYMEAATLFVGHRWEIPLPGNAHAELQAPRPMTRAQFNTLMAVLKGMEAGLVDGLEIVGPPKS